MPDPAVVLARWRDDPVAYVRENFGAEPDVWQAEALRACAGSGVHRVALRACVGPGKSTVLAWVGWWFLTVWGDDRDFPKGIALSISEDNLRLNLWTELRKWRDRSEFLKQYFEMNADFAFCKESPKRWFLNARAFSKAASVEEMGDTLSGLHEKRVLVLMDETGTMHPVMLQRADQAMSTGPEYGLILIAGNPLSRKGALFEADKDTRYTKIRITGDPDDPARSPRVNIEEARAAIAKYGRNSAWVKSHYLGEFPETDFQGLLSEEEVQAAMERSVPAPAYVWAQRRIAIDVARYGADRTVMFPRQGKMAFAPVVMRGASGPEVAARYAAARQRFRSEMDVVDDTGGYGGAVLDYARLAGMNLIPVNMSQEPSDPRFANLRAECYWRAAEWVREGGCLPMVEGLKEEATVAQYTVNNGGRLQVESKDQIKARLGRSPDLWDAFCMTFAFAEAPAVEDRLAEVSTHAAAKIVDENDPLESMAGWDTL